MGVLETPFEHLKPSFFLPVVGWPEPETFLLAGSILGSFRPGQKKFPDTIALVFLGAGAALFVPRMVPTDRLTARTFKMQG
jgi:hypothetical protein